MTRETGYKHGIVEMEGKLQGMVRGEVILRLQREWRRLRRLIGSGGASDNYEFGKQEGRVAAAVENLADRKCG